MARLIMTLAALVVYLFTVTSALQCYQCENYVTDTDSSLLSDLKSKSNPYCDSFSPLNSGTEQCPAGNYKCGMVKGSATFSIPLLGSVTAGTTVRGCMPVVAGTPDGCIDNNSEANKLVKDALNVALADVFGVTVNGNVCYCSSDMCSACDEGQAGILGFCLAIWAWCLIALGGVAALFLLSCCCCCCCRCCRNRKQNTIPQPMMIVTTHAPDGSVGIQNPGYANTYYPPGNK